MSIYSESSPNSLEPCLMRSKFRKKHFLRKVTQETFSLKSFQSLTSGFGEEDFLRVSSCLYSAKSPHSLETCLLTDQNFANKF